MAKMIKARAGVSNRPQSSVRRRSERQSLRRETVDSIQSQRQRFYGLKKLGYSGAEAAELANEEAREAADGTESGRLARRTVRVPREAPETAPGLRERSEQLKGRGVQHDPLKTRTMKAGRVARMMAPDADESGSDDRMTEFIPAMKHTHEGRGPSQQDVADAESYHKGDESVNDGKSVSVAKVIRGGRRARMEAGGSGAATVDDNWESMSYARKRAMSKTLTGQTPTTLAQADAILRREHKRQQKG